MGLRDVTHGCRARLQELEIPPGTTPDDLIALLSRRRGRPIDVLDSDQPVGLCGVWLSGDTRDLIYIDSEAQGVRRQHILLHELAHVALDHDQGDSVLDPAVVRRLFPHIDPSTVQAILGRDRYTSEEEQEAEVLAWLFLREVRPAPVTTTGSAQDLLSEAFSGRLTPRA